MAKKILTQILSEPLHRTMKAEFDINTGTGNLMVSRLENNQELLASGTLEYLEKQDPPAWIVDASDNQATLTLKSSGDSHPGFRFPWAACNGETNWQLHINPAVSSDITARSGGGNVKLNLTAMAVTRVSADSGGGNLEIKLPDNASGINVTAKTGGGNVTLEIGNGKTGNNVISATSGAGNIVVCLPGGIATRIHATTGMGKVIVDSMFSQIDKNTYQSPDYDSAVNRVEIDAKSGAGNVSVITK